ncbi:Dabb family protein [Nitriliruptoraceae bacterium ZYF776]|nr:Dabb family protein [Profundirhabdus halotolerans]
MIRHLVLFSARDRADLPAMAATLRTLADIPGVRAFELGVNGHHDALSDEVDLVVHALFDDVTALAAYKAHPVYQRSIEVVRPLRELRIAVDYEVDGSLDTASPDA